METTFAVIPSQLLGQLDYSGFLEDSQQTTRISMDGALAIVSFYGTLPQPLPGATFFVGDAIYQYLDANYYLWNPKDPE